MLGKVRGWLFASALLCSTAFSASGGVEDDIKSLMDIADTYAKAWSMDEKQNDDFLKIVKERNTKLDVIKAIYQKYKPEIDKKTETGKLVWQKIGWTCSQFDLFNSQSNTFMDDFKKNTDRRFEMYKFHMEGAEKNKAWSLCELAIKQLDENTQLAHIMQAFKGDDSPEAMAVLDKIPALKETAEKRSAAIKKATQRIVKMPVDSYGGADKEKYRAAVKKAWQKQWPSDKILKVVFPTGWKRDDEWNHNGNGSWKHSDMSFLVPWVIVQKDAKTAMMYPAYVNKNNLSGEISYGVQTKGGSFVNDEIELSKVK